MTPCTITGPCTIALQPRPDQPPMYLFSIQPRSLRWTQDITRALRFTTAAQALLALSGFDTAEHRVIPLPTPPQPGVRP